MENAGLAAPVGPSPLALLMTETLCEGIQAQPLLKATVFLTKASQPRVSLTCV